MNTSRVINQVRTGDYVNLVAVNREVAGIVLNRTEQAMWVRLEDGTSELVTNATITDLTVRKFSNFFR